MLLPGCVVHNQSRSHVRGTTASGAIQCCQIANSMQVPKIISPKSNIWGACNPPDLDSVNLISGAPLFLVAQVLTNQLTIEVIVHSIVQLLNSTSLTESLQLKLLIRQQFRHGGLFRWTSLHYRVTLDNQPTNQPTPHADCGYMFTLGRIISCKYELGIQVASQYTTCTPRSTYYGISQCIIIWLVGQSGRRFPYLGSSWVPAAPAFPPPTPPHARTYPPSRDNIHRC